MQEDTTESLKDAIRVDAGQLRSHIDEAVRSSVEETLNSLLDAEADQICGASRYERSADRVDTRAGHYQRQLETKAGSVTLKVPKLRKLPFETAIIERYRRREASVEESLVEMYLAGVSVRRVEDITEALWGSKVSSSTVSRLNQKIYRHIEAWRNRTIEGEFPYVYLDGVVLKRSWAGEVRNISVLVAIGVGTDGYRQILGVAEGEKEDLSGWSGFLRHLKDRGIKGVQLIISDACRGVIEAAGEMYPQARWQRCVVHFYRNVFSHAPNNKVGEVARMLKAIHAQEDLTSALAKNAEVVAKLRAMRRQFEQAPGFICILTGPEHVFEFINDTHHRLFGSEDWVGKPVRIAFPDLSGQGFYELLDQVYTTGERVVIHSAPIRYRLKPTDEPQERLLDFIYAPITDEAGTVTGIFCEGFDVTETLEAREKLRDSEAQLRDLNSDLEREILKRSHVGGKTWQLSPEMLCVANFEGYLESFNPAWERILGWTEADLRARPFLDFVHPDDVEKTLEGIDVLRADKPVLRFENRYRCKDGNYRWLSWVAVPDAGKCYCSARDITNDKGAIAARDRIFEISRDLFAVAGFDGYLKSINPAWSATLGLPETELLAKPFSQIIHPDDLAKTAEVVTTLQSGKPVHQFKVRLLKSDGDAIAFAWSAAPDLARDSGTFYTVGRDITEENAAAVELQQAQEALRQAQKMEAVGQLTGGIAHDFNNLLAGISGSLELLEKRLATGRLSGVDRYIDAAQSGARRAAALTQRLLAFSRRQTLDPQPVNTNKLIAGLEDFLRRSVGPTVSIEVVGAGGLWMTKIDPSQLENALLNLCINGRDAMAPDGGRLTIETANKWLD